eukprot:TRINITY_DN97_c0_g1_i14.p1 TRINITY_DN97_c0_g1~~TRINITY_DN97_c0_g1_i14.p1  ORF type:complete len:139 (-),score=27.73 TRINITY_DN97_c0_g1_i14:835-1251(-)
MVTGMCCNFLMKIKNNSASSWNLGEPIWSGSLIVTSDDKHCYLNFSSNSQLFLKVKVDTGVVEPVLDSSRYFVVKVEQGEKRAFLGLGFQERSESFDFTASLSDFKKHQNPIIINETPLDLSLKEGQKIKISLNLKKK